MLTHMLTNFIVFFFCNDTSSDATLGHIISDVPDLIGCFGSFETSDTLFQATQLRLIRPQLVP